MITMDYPTALVVLGVIASAMTLLVKYFPGKSMDDRTAKFMEEVKNLMSSQQDLAREQHETLKAVSKTVDSSHHNIHELRLELRDLHSINRR